MSSSGLYTFSPAISDLVLNAFARVQIRPAELTAEHLNDAGMESNLLMISVSNRNPNQYARETIPIELEQGVPTYNLPNRILAIGVLYMTTGTGDSAFDRTLGPISATDWGSIPNKTTQGPPTSYYLNLLPVPTLTLWPVPDANGPYLLNVQSFRQQQDASLRNGQTFDAPYRAIDALVAGLSYRMARIYKPELEAKRELDWEKAWNEFATADQEDVPLAVVPGLTSYFL